MWDHFHAREEFERIQSGTSKGATPPPSLHLRCEADFPTTAKRTLCHFIFGPIQRANAVIEEKLMFSFEPPQFLPIRTELPVLFVSVEWPEDDLVERAEPVARFRPPELSSLSPVLPIR